MGSIPFANWSHRKTYQFFTQPFLYGFNELTNIMFALKLHDENTCHFCFSHHAIYELWLLSIFVKLPLSRYQRRKKKICQIRIVYIFYTSFCFFPMVFTCREIMKSEHVRIEITNSPVIAHFYWHRSLRVAQRELGVLSRSVLLHFPAYLYIRLHRRG